MKLSNADQTAHLILKKPKNGKNEKRQKRKVVLQQA
jgi:hypothetical protein